MDVAGGSGGLVCGLGYGWTMDVAEGMDGPWMWLGVGMDHECG